MELRDMSGAVYPNKNLDAQLKVQCSPHSAISRTPPPSLPHVLHGVKEGFSTEDLFPPLLLNQSNIDFYLMLPSKWLRNASIHLDDSTPCVAMRTEASSSRVLVFADSPIPQLNKLKTSCPKVESMMRPCEISGEIFYFEIEVLSNVNEGGSSEIALGIVPVNSTEQDSLHLNTYNSFHSIEGSVAYSNAGFVARKGISNSVVSFGTRDIIGCGWKIGKEGEIFFTCNGKVISESFADDMRCPRLDNKVYFPAVELLGIGTTIRANFGKETFQYPITSLLHTSHDNNVSQTTSVSELGLDRQPPPSIPPLGHAQTHSFISRISSQLSQPLFRHSQSEPNCAISNNEKKNRCEPGQEFLQSDDYLISIASALSLEPSELSTPVIDTWTDADTLQAQEALSLLKELIQSKQSSDCWGGDEAISTLCDNLQDLQDRMRCSIDLSPENEALLHLNDNITEILSQVIEVRNEENIARNISQGNARDSTCATSFSKNPSLVSIMYMLRRGTQEEVLTSVKYILSMCEIHEGKISVLFEGDQAEAGPINDIRIAGGLQTLISTLLRCSDWPDVELQVSLAIAILVSHETDWNILLNESHAVLSSLQVLLLRKNEVNSTPEGSTLSSTSSSLTCCKSVTYLVSLAVNRFTLLLCGEYKKPVLKSFSTSSEADKLIESSLSIHHTLSSTTKVAAIKPVCDEAFICRTLESLVHIIQSLGCDFSRSNLESDSNISRESHAVRHSPPSLNRIRAKSHLSDHDNDIIKGNLPTFGTSLISRSQSSPDLRCKDSSDILNGEIPTVIRSESANLSKKKSQHASWDVCSKLGFDVEEVVVLCSHALSNLCEIEDFRASLVASDVLSLLATWLSDSTAVLKMNWTKHKFSSHSTVHKIIRNVASCLAFITASDFSPNTLTQTTLEGRGSLNKSFYRKYSNYTIGWIDAQVMAVEFPTALVNFLDLLIVGLDSEFSDDVFVCKELDVVTVLTTLISLSSRSQNRASLLTYGIPTSIVHFLEVVVKRMKNIESRQSNLSDRNSASFLKCHAEGGAQNISFCQNLAGQCLDLLSYFLSDSIDISAASPSGLTEKPPPIVLLTTQQPVISALMYLFSFPPCVSRLQAVRVLSMIVEWPHGMDLLYQEGISTALAVLLEDANERFDYDILDHVNRDNDEGCSKENAMSHHVVEEIMRSCYSLANLCHTKASYALQFFENGLMTIMLRTVRSSHIEVQRQAIRCISGMCPVLSILTPGAHPSLMIATLKSDTNLSNPTRSQSGSATETRAMAKKLHGNVIDFVNALRALTHALSSQSELIKLEALRGISHLAKDDHLSVGIVEGPLQFIITLLLDPQSATELKQLAETVLVNIGFVGGREDLDVVGNDPNLLSEWFYMRRSLRLQKSCSDLLNQWTNGLFFGCELAERKAKQLYIAELGREATLAENVDDDDSLFLHFPEGVDIDIRDTVDLVGLSVVTNVIEKIVVAKSQNINIQNTSLPIAAHKPTADLREALLLQFTHLFDAWKLLRYPQVLPMALTVPSDTFPTSSSNEWLNKSENYFHFSPGGSAKKKAGHITERFFAFMTFCTGKGAQRVIEEEEAEQKEAEEKVNGSNFIERDDHSLNLSNYDYSLEDLNEGLNCPPPKVSECLDIFFPSKLHQSLVCDSFSIGKFVEFPPLCVQHGQPSPQKHFTTPPRSSISVKQSSEQKLFKIPEPKQFRCLVLPSRPYFTFAREGRILKKLLGDIANLEKNDLSVEASSIGGYADINKTLWALAFRDSVFHGEFIMTLVNTLRSLPQISSLSFVCNNPQEDSELGYFGGNVPSTVRFLSFQNALSTASIDALCTYLRAQNVSFLRKLDDETSKCLSDSTYCKSTNQGLVGLSITCSTLSTVDVKNICDLLKGGNMLHGYAHDDGNTPTDEILKLVDSSSKVLSSPSAKSLNGLQYLDLSNNKLSDEQCSNVLFASLNTPLEGLELKGNDIHRGLYFCPVLEKYLSSPNCQLLYIGVSANSFINSTFRSFLDCCQSKNSLTSIDLSCNNLTSSERNCSRVREFLKKNITLRTLNLSNNKFTSGMTRIFHLGLLENDSLILLRLDGNLSWNEREMYLVRGKLKANRDRYVKGQPTPNHNHMSSSKLDGSLRPERHSECSVMSSHTSLKSAEKSSHFKCHDGNEKYGEVKNMRCKGHDRTFSDLGNNEVVKVSSDMLTSVSGPVVATEVETYEGVVSVATSAAYSDSRKVPSTSEATTETICVLFSAPLAWTDTRNQLHPIQTLDYPGERETLIQAFREASRDIGVRFDFATTDTLRTALSLGVKVLHFSGHGHPHCLNFEDGRSGLQFVTMDALRALCQAGGNQLEFVFVSACHSRRAGEAFVGVGVPHVVCVTVEAQLLDAAAMAFTRAFYLALAMGQTVSQSFAIGKQAVVTSPYVPNSLIEGEKFLLLPENVDHNSPVFHANSVNQWPIPGSSLRGLTCDLIDHSYLPHTPEDFEGREVDMYSTIRIILSRRLVTIVGENGCGKSSVAIAVCSYLCDRRKFEDGVVFVRLRGVSSYDDFLLSVAQAIKAGSHALATQFASLNDNIGKSKNFFPATVREQEEILLTFLSPLKALIVLGSVSALLSASTETSTDLKMFLRRLLDRSPHVKVLTTANEVVGMTGFGIIEHVVSLGPLSLYSSLRLFARLSPALATAAQKVKFVKSLLIPDQANVTLESRELSSAAAQILFMLGGGHPSKIVKIACESTTDRIKQMLAKAAHSD